MEPSGRRQRRSGATGRAGRRAVHRRRTHLRTGRTRLGAARRWPASAPWNCSKRPNWSQGIIRHLQNGVVVVDPTGQVQLLNETAQEWLDCPQTTPACRWKPCRHRWRGDCGTGWTTVWNIRPFDRPSIAGIDSPLHSTQRSSSGERADIAGRFPASHRAAATARWRRWDG